MVYRIKAAGPGGLVSTVDDVLVTEKLAPVLPSGKTPTPTLPPPPTIVDFVVYPGDPNLRGCFDVRWVVSGEVDLIQIRRNDAVILDNAPDRGSGRDCPKVPGVYTYRIDARDQAGESAFAEQSVEIAPTPAALEVRPWRQVRRSLLYSIGLLVYR